MAGTERPSTPPRRAQPNTAQPPLTPQAVRELETNRLRAKALQQQREQSTKTSVPNKPQNGYPAPIAGTKRPHAATVRNAAQPNSNNGMAATEESDIRAARKFQKFVEYDFSKMTDTKGGFMTADDDPHNKTLHKPEDKPANLTLKEWETQQLQRRLRNQRAGPYEPGLSVIESASTKKCRDCGRLEIDWAWDENFHVQVCNACKEKYPEKYSLLTKTEAKEDYLLTDPELKDEALLPHLKKPNPHKSSWNDMMLYLRFQVEEYAFSRQKWGSADALDDEFERRKKETRDRKDKKFKNKLNELKKRTRVDAYKRARGGGGGEFGDTIGRGKHEHEWGGSVEDPETGMVKKQCVECGMEVEELEF